MLSMCLDDFVVDHIYLIFSKTSGLMFHDVIYI